MEGKNVFVAPCREYILVGSGIRRLSFYRRGPTTGVNFGAESRLGRVRWEGERLDILKALPIGMEWISSKRTPRGRKEGGWSMKPRVVVGLLSKK